MKTEKDDTGLSQKATPYAWYALGLLTIIYIFNFVDRVLIYLLFAPIKKELFFTDLQLALLGSTSFVIFYTLLGIPFGRLADKVSRKKLIAFGLTIWSVFSGLTGFADTFWTIFICRMMVGIGEATLGPAALSLLSDYFPSRMRATVQAIFSSAIAMGTGVAFFFGGWINDALGWRFAFYLLGFPGLIFVIITLLLREPNRGAQDKPTDTVKTDWRMLLRNVPLRFVLFGYAFFAVAANSVSIWLPTFFVRVQKLSLGEVGFWVGIATVMGGLPGTISGGWLADKMRAGSKGGRLRLCSILAFIGIPVWFLFLNTNSVGLQIVLIGVLLGLALSWLGPAAADVNDIAGPNLRGLAVGVYFFIVNVIGYGIAPPIYGKINDLLQISVDPSVMKTTLLLSPLALFIAGTILYIGSRKLDAEQ